MSRFRLALVLLVLLGCTSTAPSPEPAVELPVAEAQRTAGRVDTVETCVLDRGKLIDVRVELQPAGDTTVRGRPFAQVYGDTGQYAVTREWYVNSETIDYDPQYAPQNVCYMKYGLPRYIAREDLVRLGEWRGVPVFRHRSDEWDIPSVLWVPVSPGCSFQGYQFEASAPPRACPRPEYRFTVP